MKIMIKCAETGEVVSTGMVTDQSAWKRLANNREGIRFLCPACNTTHSWIKGDAFLVGPQATHGRCHGPHRGKKTRTERRRRLVAPPG
jgi:hypothetical protein